MSQMKTQNQITAHQAQCFMISCMDFRLIDDIVKFMDKNGYNNNYDQFILAGASLGFTQDKFPHWGQTLSDHMGIGLSLHQFREIIFIDHIDCGAYKKFYPEIKNFQDEEQHHYKHMQMARDRLAQKFPNFKFSGYLMDLQGKCKKIQIKQNVLQVKQVESEKDKFLSNIHTHYSQQQAFIPRKQRDHLKEHPTDTVQKVESNSHSQCCSLI